MSSLHVNFHLMVITVWRDLKVWWFAQDLVAEKCVVFLFSCSNFQHRRECMSQHKGGWQLQTVFWGEKKRKRLVGLDLGESLREKLDWSQALEYEWDLHKQRWDQSQDFEMTENVMCSWKGRDGDCPGWGRRIGHGSWNVRVNVGSGCLEQRNTDRLDGVKKWSSYLS